MDVKSVSLSHQLAPIALRERLTYSPHAQAATLARFGCGHETAGGIGELVILSTCNRVELYAAGADVSTDTLIQLLEESTQVPRVEFLPFLVCREGVDAVRHLCRVAAGLESQLIGEPQILTQVGDALAASNKSGTCGPFLSAVFNTALRTGKRARTESGISRNPATISSVAVRFAHELVSDLAKAHVAIIGAGEMAELAGVALVSHGARRVTVMGRNTAQVQSIAERLHGEAAPFELLDSVLADADVVISATAAPHVLIELDHVRGAMSARPERPLLLIDIAVPRDIDPEVSTVPNVHRFDLDHLQARLDAGLSARQRHVPQVEAIIEHELAGYQAWLRSQESAPTIAELRQRARRIVEHEVSEALAQLPTLNDAERARIEHLGKRIVNRLLHEPTVRLRREAENGQGAQLAAIVRELFQLDS